MRKEFIQEHMKFIWSPNDFDLKGNSHDYNRDEIYYYAQIRAPFLPDGFHAFSFYRRDENNYIYSYEAREEYHGNVFTTKNNENNEEEFWKILSKYDRDSFFIKVRKEIEYEKLDKEICPSNEIKTKKIKI